jgi:hypothetical protein
MICFLTEHDFLGRFARKSDLVLHLPFRRRADDRIPRRRLHNRAGIDFKNLGFGPKTFRRQFYFQFFGGKIQSKHNICIQIHLSM